MTEDRAQDQGGDLPLEGRLRPPMANGEVLFQEPWQGRVFAMAVLLQERGLFSWNEFQKELIGVIGRWDFVNHETRQYEYYEHFSEALNKLLDRKNVVASVELGKRTGDYAARPHGDDH